MSRGLERFLVALRVADSQHADAIRAACPTIDLEAGAPYFRNSFPADALLVVDDGFVVVRAAAPGGSRSVITSEGGPGRLLLPPSPEEVLFGLGASRLAVVSGEAFEPILGAPGAAQILLEQLSATIGEKQEAMGNFAFPRHIDRLRRKLLQLGRNYGHVARDGIRIEFPVSHTILAEMIGSSRETVTRALDELQRTGFVVRCGHTYRLLVSPECVLGTASA